MPTTGSLSDGYHTFDELYAHRGLLFIALLKAHPQLAWRARHHADGSMDAGWFVAGLDLPTGAVTYHLSDTLWPLLEAVPLRTLERAPAWDGHTSADVLDRLRRWIES